MLYYTWTHRKETEEPFVKRIWSIKSIDLEIVHRVKRFRFATKFASHSDALAWAKRKKASKQFYDNYKAIPYNHDEQFMTR